jgi:hypothetical protein
VGFLHSSSKLSASGRAQVIDTHDSLVSRNSLGHQGGVTATSPSHSTIQLRVTPDDGQPAFEAELSRWGDAAKYYFRVGSWTYVRYDPDKPDRCDVDKDRLVQEFGHRDPDYVLTVPKNVSDQWSSAFGPSRPDQFGSVPVALRGPDPALPPADPADPPSVSDSMVSDLSRLADLRATGALSDDEFAEAKARLLNPPPA